METFDTKYFRGQGPLFIASRDANGEPAGLVFVGDVASATITPQIENGEVIENVSGSGGVGASWPTRTQFNLSMAMRSVKKEHLAIALQADLTSKAAGSVTDEAHTAYSGKFIRLEHTNISTVVVTDGTGTTTYTVADDYIVHAEEGMVEIVAGGAITDESAVLVDYDYAAQGHLATNPSAIERYLVFAGKNTANNDKQTRCEIYKCKLDPSVLSLITQEAAELPITGVIEKDGLRAVGDQFYGWKLED